jgi:hypothetical protein
MCHRDIFHYNALFITEVPKHVPGKLSPQVCNDIVGYTEAVDDLVEDLTAFSEDALTKGMYSIHLENLSISTNTNLKLPDASLKGPIISSPQHAKGQEAGMV